VGENDNAGSSIVVEPERRLLAASAFHPEPGRAYRLRFEADGSRFSIAVDGKQICSARLEVPLARSGWMGIYAYYPGKKISDLRISAGSAPTWLPATAIGDEYFACGEFPKAAESWHEVAQIQGSGPVADEARYKEGLALFRLDRHQEALAVWQRLEAQTWKLRAETHALDVDFLAGRHEQVASRMAMLQTDADQELGGLLKEQWADYVRILSSKSESFLPVYLDLRKRTFPADRFLDKVGAEALQRLQRWSEAASYYPDIDEVAAMALVNIGREEDVLWRYPGRRMAVQNALFQLGRFEELRHRWPNNSPQLGPAMILAGRAEEVLTTIDDRDSDWRSFRSWALLATGRGDELASWVETADPAIDISLNGCPSLDSVRALIAIHRGDLPAAVSRLWAKPAVPGQVDPVLVEALMRSDRVDEALALPGVMPAELRLQLLRQKILLGCIFGNRQAERDLRLQLAGKTTYFLMEPGWIFDLVLTPFQQHLDGEPQEMERAWRYIDGECRLRWAGMAWKLMAFIQGKCDEADLREQPCAAIAPAMINLGAGMRAELAGDAPSAAIEYKKYLALPLGQRLWGNIHGDPVTDRFVAWRVECLSR